VSEPFNFNLPLNKGDTIDFEVLTGYSTFAYLGTGLKVAVNPEPGTLVLLGTGIVGLAGVIRRKLMI
jgi:hypothetical protein